MKFFFIFCLCLLWVTISYGQEHKKDSVVAFFRIGSKKITVKERVDSSQVRENGDGVKFFKTKLIAFTQYEKKNTTKVLDSSLYIAKDYRTSMRPCILVDKRKKLISIFSNSKSSDFDYGMDGFIYRSDLDMNSVVKETVFLAFNAGRSPFFGGSVDGNPQLWHYSAAGRCAVFSKRDKSGQYSNYLHEKMDPKWVEEQYIKHKKILFTSLPNVDAMY